MALSSLFTDYSTYIVECLPCVNTVLGAQTRIVSETDKAPARREPVFQCGLTLTIQESIDSNRTGKLLQSLLFPLPWLSHCNTSQTDLSVWWSVQRRHPKPLSNKAQKSLAAITSVPDLKLVHHCSDQAHSRPALHLIGSSRLTMSARLLVGSTIGKRLGNLF